MESIYTLNARSLGSGMSVRPVHIIADGSLSYTITLNPQEPLSTENTGDVLSDAPQTIRLVGNYPNPFNPTTNIVFELNSGSDVHLDVYNVMGERVFSRNHGYHGIGRHTIKLDAGHLVSGVYLVRLEASGQVQSMPVTLMK